MANSDAPPGSGRTARLERATSRIRGVTRPDDILDIVAEEARQLAGVQHAWAARLENGLTVSLRSASDGGASTSDPAPQAVTALLAAARPVARGEGVVAAALCGTDAAAEGIVLVEQPTGSDAATGAELDIELAQLATVAGLALEAARLRSRIDAVAKARETLLASVSHDLRNPLNTFAMSAGLLRDDAERNDVDATRAISLITRMERATARMQGLIDDLVEASRVDARKIDYAPRDESAAQLVKDAILAARPPTPADKLAQVVADALDENARVHVDRARTLQLIAKVVAYEAKATGDSGTIRIGVTRQGDGVVFTARALGPGGAPVPTPEEGRGGLALLLARGLTEGQRGTFRVEGGDALVVVFTLPAAKA